MKIDKNKIYIYFSSIFVISFIAVLWCYTYGFFHTSEWSIPTGYGGDLYWVFSIVAVI